MLFVNKAKLCVFMSPPPFLTCPWQGVTGTRTKAVSKTGKYRKTLYIWHE